jgi:hypothetical protein
MPLLLHGERAVRLDLLLLIFAVVRLGQGFGYHHLIELDGGQIGLQVVRFCVEFLRRCDGL